MFLIIIIETGGDFVIKAQVLAGGRGLGAFTNGFQGGVHKAYKYILILF